MDEEFDSILALIDELKSEDQNTQLHAINSLHEIAGAIGQQRTREELIPYITELFDDSTQQVLLALASKLKQLTTFVGGDQQVSCLLAPLHKLVTNQDTSVRQKAVESINEVSTRIPANKIQQSIIPVIQSLVENDWYSAKISVCSMIHIIYQKASADIKRNLITNFIQLAKDDTPMVRRAAATNLSNILHLENSPEIETLFTSLSKDAHDSVRQMCLQSMIKCLDINKNLVPLIKNYVKDRSWRIRYALLEKLEEIAQNYQDINDLSNEVISMLNDSEPEVRSIALDKIQFVAQRLPPQDFAAKIIPQFDQLSKDVSVYVRISVMQSMCQLSKFLGQDAAITQILPNINKLLKDEIFQVRMSFAEYLSCFIEALSQEKIVTFVVPLLNQLMNDLQWRVRLKVIQGLPSLAEILGPMGFAEHISGSLLKWVQDSVYAVRVATLDVFKQLMKIFGAEWVKTRILPLLNILSGNPIMTKRMTALKLAEELGEVFSEQELLKVYSKLAGDPVPNVRFGVAKGIKALKKKFGRGQNVVKLLQGLKEDSDGDVRYFAEVALMEFGKN